MVWSGEKEGVEAKSYANWRGNEECCLCVGWRGEFGNSCEQIERGMCKEGMCKEM